ncbi:MAG: GntR family transcriptional regulator [Balneolaceae bacterium]
MLQKGIPRHTQISKWLRSQIEEGVFEPEEKLPSENELAKKFDVSRVTVRRALQSLESEELIYRSQGLGSFVSDRRAPHNLVRLTDFDEDMAKAGLDASSKVGEFSIIQAPGWLVGPLQLEEGTKVMQIDRLRLANNSPVAFDRTWLPILYGQLLTKEKLETSTIYKILEDEYQIRIMRGTYRFTADVADDSLAEELNIGKGAPLLVIERSTYTIGNKPIYFQRRYYRNDRVTYEMTLERPQEDRDSSNSFPLKEFLPVFSS